jgi:hypothetical protein
MSAAQEPVIMSHALVVIDTDVAIRAGRSPFTPLNTSHGYRCFFNCRAIITPSQNTEPPHEYRRRFSSSLTETATEFQVSRQA